MFDTVSAARSKRRVLAENNRWNIRSSPYQFILAPKAEPVPLILPAALGQSSQGAHQVFAAVKAACADFWPKFWNSGGAIDLSGSRDPRWPELERRIVLSQYEWRRIGRVTIRRRKRD